MVFFVNLCSCSKKNVSEKYRVKFEDCLINENQVELRKIFDFEFDRAYVFKDAYLDGISFCKKYNLDLNIDEVKETYHEEIRRIVFVDKAGNFIFEFQYTSGKNLIPQEEGMIVYPTTVVKRTMDTKISNRYIIFEFLDVKAEDYY